MRASKEARIHKAWREQVARLIALAVGKGDCEWCNGRRVDGDRDCPACGGRFDVALARSYAESLIAEGERPEAERVAFMDWTRTQAGPVPEGLSMSLGMGPENREPFAFRRCRSGCTDDGWHEHWHSRVCVPRAADDARGGWPGPLAREWGTVRCEACELLGRKFVRECTACDSAGFHDDPVDPLCLNCRGSGRLYERCKPCKGRGYVKHPKREAAAANGGAHLIRIGRRLLDTLDGRCPWAPSAARQESECECARVRSRYGYHGADDGCNDCHGTGHNLSGTLPPVEHSPQVCRAAMDGIEAAGSRSPTQWQRDVAMQWARSMVGPPFRTVLAGLDVPTRPLTYLRHVERAVASGEAPGRADVRVERADVRVVPRGEHRRPGAGYYVRPQDVLGLDADERPSLDDRINGRCYDSRTMLVGDDLSRWPRWHRGEIRHSEQRRERERRRSEPLGIRLSVSEAQRIYADRLGLTVEQLTEQQTREAIQQAALEAIERRVAPQDSRPRVTGT